MTELNTTQSVEISQLNQEGSLQLFDGTVYISTDYGTHTVDVSHINSTHMESVDFLPINFFGQAALLATGISSIIYLFTISQISLIATFGFGLVFAILYSYSDYNNLVRLTINTTEDSYSILLFRNEASKFVNCITDFKQ